MIHPNIREYFVGVDLGKRRDYSALAVVERTWVSQAGYGPAWMAERLEARLSLRFLERVRLGTPYPKVVARVREVAGAAIRAGTCAVIVDATGVGGPVVDLLRGAELRCELEAVTITGGERAARVRGGWNVPKEDLVVGLRVAFERRELGMAAGLRWRREFLEEMMHFGQAGKVHDDLVMAVALALWGAGRGAVGERGERLCY